jgi:hypothetical protein
LEKKREGQTTQKADCFRQTNSTSLGRIQEGERDDKRQHLNKQTNPIFLEGASIPEEPDSL